MDHFPLLNTKDGRTRGGWWWWGYVGGDWQRIYQYLYRKQHVMVTLIPFPTFYCANHTRGSIRVLPPVENTRLDCH